MKTFISGLFLLCISLPSHALNVFACEAEWASLMQSVAPHATIYTAVKVNQDPHFMQATPSLIAKMRQADFAICTGAELEKAWLDLVLRKAHNAAMHDTNGALFYAAEQVERINKHAVIDRSQGDIHAQGNPHVFTSPTHMLTIIQALAQRLSKIDAAHASTYQTNANTLINTLQTRIQHWTSLTAPLKGKQVIVSHSDFLYFLTWLGLEVVGDIEPKPGIPPTTAHLAKLKHTILQTQPMAIIISTLYNDKGAMWLHAHTNLPVIKVPHTTGAQPNTDDLISFYDTLIHTLVNVPVSP